MSRAERVYFFYVGFELIKGEGRGGRVGSTIESRDVLLRLLRLFGARYILETGLLRIDGVWRTWFGCTEGVCKTANEFNNAVAPIDEEEDEDVLIIASDGRSIDRINDDNVLFGAQVLTAVVVAVAVGGGVFSAGVCNVGMEKGLMGLRGL